MVIRGRKKDDVGDDRGYFVPKPTNNCLCTLLSAVPLYVFTRMTMKSGLPPLEQRRLCDTFKRLKG